MGKTQIKVLMCLLLAAVLMLCSNTAKADIVSTGSTTTASWTLDDEGLLTVSGTYIPEDCFRLNDAIVSVIIKDGVTGIGPAAFRDCHNLTSVVIPESVTAIDNFAFAYCRLLPEIKIPSQIKSIGDWAFVSCWALSKINLADSLEHLGYAALDTENNNIFITANLESYAANAVSEAGHNFYVPGDFDFGLRYITVNEEKLLAMHRYTGTDVKVTTPSYSQYIGSYAFDLNETVETVVMNDGVVGIGAYAFKDCASLISVTIPESVTAIEDFAFELCNSLPEVTIPSQIKSIGKSAFNTCRALSKINLPDSLEFLGFAALSTGGNTFITANLESYAANAVSEAGLNFYVPGDFDFGLRYITVNEEKLLAMHRYTGTDVKVTTPSYSQYIGSYAFDLNETVETVVMNDGVVGIGAYAFKDCHNLTSVTIPESVTTIENSAFIYCGSLQEVTLPAQIKYIGDNAFISCRSLSKINLPDSLEQLGRYALNTGAYTFITANRNSYAANAVSEAGLSFYVPGDFDFGLRYITVDEEKHLILNIYTGTTAEAIIPDGLWYIADGAFRYNASVETVVISEGITGIGQEAFSGCSSLSSVTIPDSVTSLGRYAFNDCNSLLILDIPDSVTAIDSWGLVNPRVTACRCTLGGYASRQLSAMGVNFYVTGDSSFLLRYIQEGEETPIYLIGYFGEEVDVETPDYIGGIGASAFRQTNVENVVLNEGIVNIGRSAFELCGNLKSVTIPSTVKYVDYSAFWQSGVTEVVYGGIQPMWRAITFSSLNDKLLNANITYAQVDTLYLPASLVCVDSEAFTGTAPEYIALPVGCTTIGSKAFAGISSLRHVLIPASVTDIAPDAFTGCSDVTIYAQANTPAAAYATEQEINLVMIY